MSKGPKRARRRNNARRTAQSTAPARPADAPKTNPEQNTAKRPAEDEPSRQFTLHLRESLHRALAVAALERGTSMRGIILDALKQQGFDVADADLLDKRRRA